MGQTGGNLITRCKATFSYIRSNPEYARHNLQSRNSYGQSQNRLRATEPHINISVRNCMLEKLHIYESSKQEMGPQENNICFHNISSV